MEVSSSAVPYSLAALPARLAVSGTPKHSPRAPGKPGKLFPFGKHVRRFGVSRGNRAASGENPFSRSSRRRIAGVPDRKPGAERAPLEPEAAKGWGLRLTEEA